MNDIGDEGALALSEALMTNRSLVTLSIICEQQQSTKDKGRLANFYGKTGNGISSKGARALSEALKVNSTLTTLKLTGEAQQQSNAKQRSADDN